MLTLFVYAVVAVLAVALLFGLSVAFLPRGEQISPPARDRPVWKLPGQRLSGDDVARTRLPVGWRGYRFEETDLLLDRLADELRARDERIAELESGPEPAAEPADGALPVGEVPVDQQPVAAEEQ